MSFALTTCRDYALRRPATWHAVYASSPCARTPPHRYGSIAVDFAPRVVGDFPEIGVLELPRATLATVAGWVQGEDGSIFSDTSWFGSELVIPPVPHPDRLKRRRLRGICVSIASEWGSLNYGHFLLDCLSRLHLFAQAGFTIDQIDHVYLPPPPSAGAAAIVSRLIPEAKCVWATNDTLTDVDTLVVSSFPGLRRNYPAWVPTYLRACCLDGPPPPSSPDRRLYVRRQSRQRNLLNDAAIARILESRGFEIYDHARVRDEPDYFARAACVIGPHDAGLANLAFCTPGTRVIELVPTDHVYPYYFTLAESAGLHYGYLAGHSTARRPEGVWGPSPFDFQIDTGECRTAAEELLQ